VPAPFESGESGEPPNTYRLPARDPLKKHASHTLWSRSMAQKPKKEAVKPEEPKSTITRAKGAVVKAAEKVAEVVTHAAKAVQEHVVPPVVEAVKQPKRPRFIREKKEKRRQPKPAPLPPRSTKATAKLMTKGLAVPPKEGKAAGQKPNT
jgi:hypothetical protein